MVTPPINNGEFGTFFIRWTQDSLGQQQLLLKSPTTYRGNMRLLLLVLLGLVAGALCQEDPQEFVVVDDAGPSDELESDDLDEYQNQAQDLLKTMGSRPEPYAALAKSNPNPGFEVSTEIAQRSPCEGLNLYECPYDLIPKLSWFPVRYGSFLYAICYVPWPTYQGVTYAKCKCKECDLPKGRKGRCRPSCYQKRRMLVYCWNYVLKWWGWRWITRSLPQNCLCSAC
ncbi:hypothetical protein BaRGS_00037125 [Batillaria attramentaria]|uniref:Uncharacterized protein n=1 Tax=Batillaria attramentaria TaxID=370345 RepID=A0ABD0J9U0_9CAEN